MNRLNFANITHDNNKNQKMISKSRLQKQSKKEDKEDIKVCSFSGRGNTVKVEIVDKQNTDIDEVDMKNQNFNNEEYNKDDKDLFNNSTNNLDSVALRRDSLENKAFETRHSQFSSIINTPVSTTQLTSKIDNFSIISNDYNEFFKNNETDNLFATSRVNVYIIIINFRIWKVSLIVREK